MKIKSMRNARLSPLVLLLMMVIISGVVSRDASGKEASRVREARANKQARVENLFADAGVSYPPAEVFIRVFKLEAELELWARDQNQERFALISTYPICYVPGELGPKRREGDNQVPEGVYRITVFNPWSSYHLSMGINYPNRSDRILGDPERPGGEIFIHGECVSIGCVPIRNGPIEEVYLTCLDNRTKYRRDPVVHIFPCRMNTATCQRERERRSSSSPEQLMFWKNLEEVYIHFERMGRPPSVRVDNRGRYVIK